MSDQHGLSKQNLAKRVASRCRSVRPSERNAQQKGLVEPTRMVGPLAHEAPAEGLVMMLHGAGDSADGLMQIAQCWAADMPTVAFLMPSAPERRRYSSWFARDHNAPTHVKPCCNYETITEQLLELLDSARRRLGLEYSQICLWGYSAGALMSSWLALQLRESCAGLVLLHGTAPDARLPSPPPAPAGPRPPALMLAGAADVQIPPRAVERAASALRELHGFLDIDYRVAAGQDHSIGEEEIQDMFNFLIQKLKLSTEDA